MARRKWSDKALLLCALLLFSCRSVHSLRSLESLRDGDLLFHVVEGSNAITAVTHGTQSLSIDHVAIYYTGDDGSPLVVQAVYDGVVTTPLDTLLSEPGYYIAGRVSGADLSCSVRHALSHLGKPYDFVFSPTPSEVYCSELVLLSYVDQEGHPLFAPTAMTFRDSTGSIPAYWQSFYGQRNLTVPEGAPGSNPGELSRRPEVKIKYDMRDFAKRRYQRGPSY